MRSIRGRHPLRASAFVSLVAAALVGCGPRSVEEAEAKGNVSWLVEHTSAPSVAALGRLSDQSPEALQALKDRAQVGSTAAFIAAWDALRRGSSWGKEVLDEALRDPRRAERAARALTPGDPHLAEILPALDAGFVADKSGSQGLAIAALLASAGKPAARLIEARLQDGTTRASMCQGLGAKEATRDARQVLLAVTPDARDSASCIDLVIRLVEADSAAFEWLAASGEPGLLREASESNRIPCGRMRSLWSKVFASRKPEEYASLTFPLAGALQRCPKDVDLELSRALTSKAEMRPALVDAVNPSQSLAATMPLTCVALAAIAKSKERVFVKQRAAEAASGACEMR